MQENIEILNHDQDALQIAEGELRHLRETIEALRIELEQHSLEYQ